ncbi:hypothetical protein U9M48_044022 [Paspalum notatum var. saurae]|uniref:Uncharacterized protein n=1 Tax=Paspalum notatum var. saurae TaxID=547442 RepID=A0AAQ3XHS4_PASNO
MEKVPMQMAGARHYYYYRFN